jgi:hypothetical protein
MRNSSMSLVSKSTPKGIYRRLMSSFCNPFPLNLSTQLSLGCLLVQQNAALFS